MLSKLAKPVPKIKYLVLHDNERIATTTEILMEMDVIKSALEDRIDQILEIPIPNKEVDTPTILKVISFIEYHLKHRNLTVDDLIHKSFTELPQWYRDYCLISRDEFKKLGFAANFLDVKLLRVFLYKYVLYTSDNLEDDQMRILLNHDPLTDAEKEETEQELSQF